MNTNELKDRIKADCYQEIDGFWVYGPLKFQGYLNEYHLNLIIEVLRELNAPMEQAIQAELIATERFSASPD